MNLNGINLVEYNGYYMLVNYSLRKPVMVSKRVYDTLSEVKKGTPIQELKEKYGEDLLEIIEKKMRELEERKVLECSETNFGNEGMKAIERLRTHEVEILEGNIMVSQDCNMACKYCYGGESGRYNLRGLMSVEMAEKCFRFILEAGGNRSFQKIVFFGGEPLLNMRAIRHVILTWENIKHLYPGREIYFTLTTNGSLLTPEIVEFFRDYKVGISFSLDGPKEIHDANRVMVGGTPSFERVMDAIDLMREYKLPISIRTTVTKNTDYDKFYTFFERQNFDVHTLAIVDYPVIHPKKEYQFDLASYNEFMKKQREVVCEGCDEIRNGKGDSFKAKQMSVSFHKPGTSNYPFLCGAGNWFFAFGLDGYIYPCNRVVGQKKFRIGDIDNGIDQEKMAGLLVEFLHVSKNCNCCWAAAHCKGRCFHQKLNDEGKLEALPEALCDIYRENIADSLLFAHKMKKYIAENKKDFDKALIRYNADHMMENLKNGV
ncbi:MAG: radical SAM protein [Lachnospiraceae bacterium]|nr:radical SAM protein [Lachnospiraceae bacterium]